MIFYRRILAAIVVIAGNTAGLASAQLTPDLADISRGDDTGWWMHTFNNEETSCLLPNDRDKHTPAKVMYRPVLNSDELLIFVSGGGSCNSYETCVKNQSNSPPKNVNGYTKEDFKNENKLDENLYLRTEDPSPDDSRDNPFMAKNMAFIPYCTGDMHSGIQAVKLTSASNANDSVKARFWGHKNFQKSIEYLHGLFPNVNTIYLLGQSAGAGGVVLQYPNVVARWSATNPSVKVHLIEDSAPVLVSEQIADENRRQWNAECDYGRSAAEVKCPTLQQMRKTNRSEAPDFKHAMIKFEWDGVLFSLSGAPTLEEYGAQVSQLNSKIENGAPEYAKTLNIKNTSLTTDGQTCERHVVTNYNIENFSSGGSVQPNGAIQKAHYKFILAFLGQTTPWESYTLDLFGDPMIGCPEKKADVRRTGRTLRQTPH